MSAVAGDDGDAGCGRAEQNTERTRQGK
jgi:hypothetical protein